MTLYRILASLDWSVVFSGDVEAESIEDAVNQVCLKLASTMPDPGKGATLRWTINGQRWRPPARKSAPKWRFFDKDGNEIT